MLPRKPYFDKDGAPPDLVEIFEHTEEGEWLDDAPHTNSDEYNEDSGA